MNNEQLIASGWTIVKNAAAVSKPLLWLRDTDSALPLTPELIQDLRSALRTVAGLPRATAALCDKMVSIYQRALDKPWVGIGAQERSTRLGRRTAQFGLMYALEYARKCQPQFNAKAKLLKDQASSPQPDGQALFVLAEEFIDYLDWGEFVIENPRGQASNLVLESMELLDAIQFSTEKVHEETGDVFYNLLAFCLSMRIRSYDIFCATAQDQEAPDYRKVLKNPGKVADFINGRIDSKLDWYRRNMGKYSGRQWPTWQKKVLEVLYEDNLGIDVSKYGRVLREDGNVLIIEWTCPCPILDRCRELGCDTGEVCSTLYHVQYQVLLSLLVPDAFFARDYSQLRPKGDACVEVIVRRPDLEESFSKRDS